MVLDSKDIINSVILVKRFIRSYKDVTFDQLVLMLCMYDNRRIDIKELSRMFAVSEQYLVKSKKNMIKAGYIVDHYTLALSDKGIELCKEFRRFVLLSSPI
jgi:hypothetical protein